MYLFELLTYCWFVFLKQMSDYEPSLPITEKSNPITIDIDRANPNQIVQMLQKCDAEIFERTSDKGSIYQVCATTTPM